MRIGSSLSAMKIAKGWFFLIVMAGTSCAKFQPLLEKRSPELTMADESSAETRKFKAFLGPKIHLEVEPLGEKSQVFYFVDPKDLAAGLALKKSIVVRGNAQGFEELIKRDQARDAHDKSPAFSAIIALPTANKAGFLSPRIPNGQAELLADQSFKLDLTSGLSYAVILNPSGLYDRAPLYVNLPPSDMDTTLSFLYNPEATKLTGEVRTDNSPFFHKKNNPLLKARILQGNRLVSSTASVDEEGQFWLEIAPAKSLSANSPLTLVIAPTSNDCGLPTIKHSLDAAKIYDEPNLGIIELGKLGKPFSATIALIADGENAPMAAEIYLNARIGNGEALVKKTVNNQGVAVFDDLYEGLYDLAVVVPCHSPFGMRIEKGIRLSQEHPGPITISLPKRESLKATVVDESGKTVAGAHVAYSRIGKMGAFASEDILDDLLFKQTLITNNQGQVCNQRLGPGDESACKIPTLDEGRYMAHIIPPAGSELSHAWMTFDFPKDKTIQFRLTEPEVLTGKIVAPDQLSPVKQAYITIYVAEANLYNQPKIVANAITDDQGFFRALVATAPTKAVQTTAY